MVELHNPILAGDIHGQVHKLTAAIDAADIRGRDVVILGDVGLGFFGNHTGPLPPLQRMAEARDLRFLIFRGNHDNPESYGEERRKAAESKFSRVKFLGEMDEVRLENGKTGLVVPGSLSVDRNTCRLDLELGCYVGRIEGKQYWRDETMDYDQLDRLALDIESGAHPRYDFVLAHTCIVPPDISNGEFMDFMKSRDPELEDDLAREQNAVHNFILKAKPAYWMAGHFHMASKFDCEGCRCIVLDKDTIEEMPRELTEP